MSRVIFLCPYLKGNGRTGAQRQYYVKYIATREGVELINDSKKLLPATWRQKKLIEDIVKDFPETAERFEYEDYIEKPTRENASAFISVALEQNLSLIEKRENYVDYIAHRPRAEHLGSHGLFSGKDEHIVLDQVAKTAAEHPGNMWMPIISLRREDAARLGYDNATNWRAFLSSYAADLAVGLKIKPDQFRWYAAYHDEGHHPHVHMVCWSTDQREGFLNKSGIRDIKAGIASRIFRQELLHVYDQQTEYRNLLNTETQKEMETLIARMEQGTLHSEPVENLMSRLVEKLRHYKGKKQYGYLSASVKEIVDRIVDELAKDGRVADVYAKWCEARLEVLRTYLKEPPHPGPLSQQKELKRIRNIVVEEAAKIAAGEFIFEAEPREDATLSYISDAELRVPWFVQYRHAKAILRDGDKDIDQAVSLLTQAAESEPDSYASYVLGKLYLMGSDIPRDREKARYWLERSAEQGNEYAQFFLDHFDRFHDPSCFMTATRMLHHLGRIFRDNPPLPLSASGSDSKQRRREREKKIALGYARDDHELNLN
ncbi:MAG: relaxase MobL [Oscillospiraceae bacterium]|jgi:hypothetical protein|nr:relaxase MobL [Oscillospiraceae bacterium]